MEMLNDNPLVSIIIPVFNAGDNLSKCLESVIKQKEKRIEILLVDDGSTDGSDIVCDSFAGVDSRIKVFHIENKGVSNARNYALKRCKGEYVGFVDADDEIDESMYDELINASDGGKYDIVQCGYQTIYENKKDCPSSFEFSDIIYQNIEEFLFYPHKKIANCVWNKIFHKRIYSNVFFDLDIKVGEDLKYNLESCSIARSIKLIDKSLYKYYVRSNSAMTSASSSKRLDDFKVDDWCFLKYRNNQKMLKLVKTRDAELCFIIYYLAIGEKQEKAFKKHILNRLKNDKDRYRLPKKYEISIFMLLHFSCLFDFVLRVKYAKKRKQT